MALSDPITDIKGLGKQSANKLAQFGIKTQEQLLFHFPSSYQNKTKITPLAKAIVGEQLLLELSVYKTEIIYTAKRQLVCFLTDDDGDILLLRFFHFSEFQASAFTRGAIVQCFGEVVLGRQTLEIIHPQYSIISNSQKPLLAKTLSPVYPNTLGIATAKLKSWIKLSLDLMYSENILDIATYCNFNIANLPSITDAIYSIHYPENTAIATAITNWTYLGQERLIIDELCSKNLALLQLKIKRRQKQAYPLSISRGLVDKLKNMLNFKLTNAQNRVINEILSDLNSEQAMLRLLQGDVGSGKTIVAVFASLAAVASGKQVAIMAPTEILAQQHFKGFSEYFDALGYSTILLTASQDIKVRRQNIAACKNNDAHIIIGTHILFQDKVVFAKLGFIIIDEQHKFGVHQRLKLVKKSSKIAHQLVMTATPIPRSLAMSAYADLDTSTIDEMPVGRKPIKTIVLSSNRKQEVLAKIQQVCSNNNQVYWVCTLIDDSDALEAQSAIATLEYLTPELPDIKIELIHGRLDKDTKLQIMQRFYNKEIDLLIATTVIEVGVDVSNASLMIIENAERLGLAQLHQLRGRVGRGVDNSICILMYQKPLGGNAKQRLDILRQSNDGFKIAQRDLELRGPGEILGTQQTGITQYKMANLVRDDRLLGTVQQVANCMLAQDKTIQDTLIKRWNNEQAYRNI